MRSIGLVSATDLNSDDKRYIDDTREEFKWNCLNKKYYHDNVIMIIKFKCIRLNQDRCLTDDQEYINNHLDM